MNENTNIRKSKELKLEIDDSVDKIIDEAPGGNSFIALRRLRWSESSPFRLDIRKWYTSSTGEEIAGKGVSFITQEGPDNLVNGLIEMGYGETQKVIDSIKDRPDFLPTIKRVLTDMDVNLDDIKEEAIDSLQEFYDPKGLF